MAALLCDIKPGDEVIMPSFTFVSTANTFLLRGAKIRVVDSKTDHFENAKFVVAVHYGESPVRWMPSCI